MKRMVYLSFIVLFIGAVFFSPYIKAGDFKQVNLIVKEEGEEELISLRQLASELDWQLAYLNEERAIMVNGNKERIKLEIGAETINNQNLETTPKIIDGRTWIGFKTAAHIIQTIDSEKRILLTGLSISEKRYKTGEEIVVKINAYNPQNSKIILDFSSGQRYDFYLKKNGQEVWRWSEGKFFTMALAREEIAPGQELEYQADIPSQELAPGRYTLAGELTTLNGSLKLAETNFEIID